MNKMDTCCYVDKVLTTVFILAFCQFSRSLFVASFALPPFPRRQAHRTETAIPLPEEHAANFSLKGFVCSIVLDLRLFGGRVP